MVTWGRGAFSVLDAFHVAWSVLEERPEETTATSPWQDGIDTDESAGEKLLQRAWQDLTALEAATDLF